MSSCIIEDLVWIDPRSDWHQQKISIRIGEGLITEVRERRIEGDGPRLHADGYFGSAGWCDLGTQTQIPVDETDESVFTLSQTALRGGYTHLGLFSAPGAAYDHRAPITDIEQDERASVALIPIPSASKGLRGEQLGELLDTTLLGMKLVSDGYHGTHSTAFHQLALDYIGQTEARYMYIPAVLQGIGRGQVDESEVSAHMGLPGIPAHHEAMSAALMRRWADDAGTPVLHHAISSKEALDALDQADQDRHLASVSAMHLVHTSEDVLRFNENYKVLPPLRSALDRQALVDALRDGRIQIIISNHTPLAKEKKARAFGFSPFGAATLDSTFHMVCTALPDAQPEDMHRWLCAHPRMAAGVAHPPLEVGMVADITLFRTDGTRAFAPWNQGLAKNTLYDTSSQVRGHIGATFFRDQAFISDEWKNYV